MLKSRCYVEINKEAFRFNTEQLIRYLPESTKIIGVIKANYYGHDDWETANILWQCGVRDFCVATLAEAINLRNRGLGGSLMVLGYVEKKDWLLAQQYDIILSLASPQMAREMIDFARDQHTRLKVEVKVDTGMHRIGLDAHLSQDEIDAIYGSEYLLINGTFSHLCRADSFAEADRAYTYQQKERFDQFLARVRNGGNQTGRTHLCASSGILNYPEFQYDYVRPGFLLLGFEVGETVKRFETKPVMGWYSKIEMIKTLAAGEGISYGQIYHCESERRIATLSVGYGDGYPRRLSNKGYVVINGKQANIVGRICMDQMMVDVTDIDCAPEDVVTLIGSGCTANDLAEMADTIVDEIVCDINPRVERFII